MMGASCRRWNIVLTIRHSSLVSVWGDLDGVAFVHSPARCRDFPAALQVMRFWLEDFDPEANDRIMGIVRAPELPISAWSTSSSSAALYWFATQLCHSWLHLPELARWREAYHQVVVGEQSGQDSAVQQTLASYVERTSVTAAS